MCGTVLRLTLNVLALKWYGLISSFQGLNFVIVVYDPTEGDVEEREKSLNNVDVVVGNGYRLCVLGDVNE